jgi:hypothetical protein
MMSTETETQFQKEKAIDSSTLNASLTNVGCSPFKLLYMHWMKTPKLVMLKIN